ncbi:hypothetical protein [Paraburkholderia antibiotica]|uniref:Uncharacterized protein n=1 Tax=Paraburkholderia antibiotica TaxID=2728839 RepID=A0A7Y0FFW6_9BURK|nr:hypothetical protein [Paraburkholderia antibiotica]NML34533.1 hypothetical protein [Paraburkholderia antibiotica]
MARIRTIKPDFWTDDKLVELDFATRLFFIGTWNHADDNGNLRRSAKSLKMKIFPADAIDCEPLIQSLITHGMLIEYSVSGADYLHIRCFSKHQVINRKSKSAIPLPPWLSGDAAAVGHALASNTAQAPATANDSESRGSPEDFDHVSRNAPPEEPHHSVNTHGLLTEDSLTEKEVEEEKEGSKPKGSNDDVGNLIRGSAVDNSAASSSLPVDEIAALLTQWECERGKEPRIRPDDAALKGLCVTAEQLRRVYDAAVAQRTRDHDRSAINSGFIASVAETALAPPKVVKPPLRGMTGDQLKAEADRLGVHSHGKGTAELIALIEHKRGELRGGHAA